jgi:hypothetical protein
VPQNRLKQRTKERPTLVQVLERCGKVVQIKNQNSNFVPKMKLHGRVQKGSDLNEPSGHVSIQGGGTTLIYHYMYRRQNAVV